MARPSKYSDIVSFLDRLAPPDWIRIFSLLPTLDLKKRKAIITLCRARSIPQHPDSTLFRNAWIPLAATFDNEDLYEALVEILSQADTTSILLSMTLSAPYSATEVSDIFKLMEHKEISAMESTPREPSVNWHSLYDRFNHTLSRDTRPAPTTQQTFRQMIDTWLNSLQSVVIYPHSGSKSVSYATLREYNDMTGNEFESISSTQLEQFYCETGLMVPGPCEMRQVWYPTIATPRTYYAMGGDAYFKSRYVRDIFNLLADLVPMSNRFTRVDPAHVNVVYDEDTYIYDLTSFTSLYHEQRNFLDFLANIVIGFEVRIMDSHHGIRVVQLSDLIVEYNLLNKEPKYSLERVWGVPIELCHSIAGFLGVYGNLMTCTIPHSIMLMTLTDRTLKQWCAGDDAGTVGKRDDLMFRHDLKMCAETQGVISMEKTYCDRELDPVIALKRRIIRLPNLLSLLPNILFPAFSVFFDQDPRFNQDMYESFSDRLSTFCSGLMSMLYQIHKSQIDIGDLSFLISFLPELYRHIGLPLEGFFPPLCGHMRSLKGFSINFTVPRILGDYWKRDPNVLLLDAFMPLTFQGPSFVDMPWNGEYSDEIICNSHRHLNFLEKMGFFVKEEVQSVYELTDDVRFAVYKTYLKNVGNDQKIVYKYTKQLGIPQALG